MAPRNRKTKQPEQTSTLTEALKFVSVAQRAIGAPYQTHVVLYGQNVFAFDGVLAAGMRTEEDIIAAPNTTDLINALTTCGNSFQITQLNSQNISVKNATFNAFVPCIELDTMPYSAPDQSIVPVGDELKAALAIVAPLATDNAQTMIAASILLSEGCATATDRSIMFQAWHGCSLPTIAIPKVAALALIKCPKKLVSFGYSSVSATFYFEDGSWIRTQLFQEPWPDIERILGVKATLWPVPQGFYDGVRAVMRYNDKGRIIFGQNILRSHREDFVGATYQINGIPNGPMYSAKYLLMLEPYVKSIDFVGQRGVAYFVGDKFRGSLCSLRE